MYKHLILRVGSLLTPMRIPAQVPDVRVGLRGWSIVPHWIHVHCRVLNVRCPIGYRSESWLHVIVRGHRRTVPLLSYIALLGYVALRWRYILIGTGVTETVFRLVRKIKKSENDDYNFHEIQNENKVAEIRQLLFNTGERVKKYLMNHKRKNKRININLLIIGILNFQNLNLQSVKVKC